MELEYGQMHESLRRNLVEGILGALRSGNFPREIERIKRVLVREIDFPESVDLEAKAMEAIASAVHDTMRVRVDPDPDPPLTDRGLRAYRVPRD